MTTVGAYELKTHAGQLLDRVERGESIAITRRGKRVAVLMPDRPQKKPRDIRELIRKMDALRRKTKPLGRRGLTLRQLAHEGHRY